MVSFGGNRYSLPPGYAGKNVWVRTSQGRCLEVHDQKGNLIFRHTLSQKKGVTILVEEHYAQLKQRQCRTKAVLERDFLEKLYVQQKLNPVFHLKPILELATIYPREAMLKAFALAKEYNTLTAGEKCLAEMFGNDIIASAILDRLLHFCHIIPASGLSYRIKDKLENLKRGELKKYPG